MGLSSCGSQVRQYKGVRFVAKPEMHTMCVWCLSFSDSKRVCAFSHQACLCLGHHMLHSFPCHQNCAGPTSSICHSLSARHSPLPPLVGCDRTVCGVLHRQRNPAAEYARMPLSDPKATVSACVCMQHGGACLSSLQGVPWSLAVSCCSPGATSAWMS